MSEAEFSDLLDALKAFAKATEGMELEDTPDDLAFWPVNALKPNACPILVADMKKAMKIYKKYKKCLTQN